MFNRHTLPLWPLLRVAIGMQVLLGMNAPHARAQAQAVTAANHHTCAVTAAGGVKCWGLGDGLVPVDVSGLTSGVQAVTAGGFHTCVLTTAGGVKCWGSLTGDGTMTDRLVPVDVNGLTSGVQAVTAGLKHTCALTDAGGVKCWGDNLSGQLGDGTTSRRRLVPVDVSGLTSGVQAVTAGGSHTCALTTAGGVKCWGSNTYGAVGDGSTTDRLVPVDVSGPTSEVQAVTAGGSHTCALTAAGGVMCWGDNSYGRLGDGTMTDRLVPVDVSGLTSGVQAVTAGDLHTCALTAAGGVMCWGYNSWGELGDGTISAYRLVPVDVSGLTSGVQAVTAGRWHTCALTTAGGVKCWGDNYFGDVGDGTTTLRRTPVDVVGFSTQPPIDPGPFCTRFDRFTAEGNLPVGDKKKLSGELHGKVELTKQALVRTARLEGTGRGCILNNCYDFVSLSVDGRSGGGSLARLKVGMLPAWTKDLSGSGPVKKAATIELVKVSGTYRIIPGVNIKAEADVGAGYDADVGYRISPIPARADLHGTARAFANGSGSIGVSVLEGIGGEAWGDATLTFPSPVANAELYTELCGKTGSTASIVLQPWRLTCGLHYQIGCVFGHCAKRGNKTLLDKQGNQRTLKSF